MIIAFLIGTLLWSETTPDTSIENCAEVAAASAAAYRLADLPEDVRDRLAYLEQNLIRTGIADGDAPLLQTDAPSLAERTHPTIRFKQAVLIGDIWFVQLEVSMTAGVRTISFHRRHDGRFDVSHDHYFSGPACASIRAALDGVRTPGGF